jgi:dTDP-4-dehydrorhamnose reductase
MARFDECRQFPELAHRVNVEAPLDLARSLTLAGARLIFLSTSAVFDCRTPYVDEEERPAPRSVYGRLKAEAEAALLGVGPQVSVLRLTKVLKPNSGIVSDWIRKLGEGRAIRAFDDHRFCPLRVEDVVRAVLALIERGEDGVYHVSGAADLSFADVAVFLARQIGADVSQVEAVHGSGNGINDDDLTPFTSLATGRLSRLTGFVPPQPFDVLQDVYGGEIAAARQLMAANAG